MIQKIALYGLMLISLLGAGILSCGGSNLNIASIEITNCPATPLEPGDTQQLTVVARDANGNVIGSVSFTFDSSNPRFVSVSSSGVLDALYPGAVAVTASSGGITSNACNITVDPLTNSGTVTNLGMANREDNFAANNMWKMISRGYVLWQRVGAIDTEVLIQQVSSPGATPITLKTVDTATVEIDFMALGSGAGDSDILASWREGLMNTLVSDGDPASNVNLGDNEQEENSIANGCLLFRKNTVQDILRFTFADGLTTLASTGILSNPITSQCEAIWLEDAGGGNFNLIYFDGVSETPIATGPFSQGRFDFRNGRIVYSLNSDIFLYDTTAANPQSQNITNNPLDLNNFVKTDGDSILISRVAGGVTNQIVLYDIASAQENVISTTTNVKEGTSLEIDLKQAVWREGDSLFFHNGNGQASGTAMIPLGGNTLVGVVDRAYIDWGIVTWVADNGVDDDVFVMQ